MLLAAYLGPLLAIVHSSPSLIIAWDGNRRPWVLATDLEAQPSCLDRGQEHKVYYLGRQAGLPCT